MVPGESVEKCLIFALHRHRTRRKKRNLRPEALARKLPSKSFNYASSSHGSARVLYLLSDKSARALAAAAAAAHNCTRAAAQSPVEELRCQWWKTAHSALGDIFHNHSVRGYPRKRERVAAPRSGSLAIAAIDIFFVYTRLVLRDIIVRYDPPRLIIVRLFSPDRRRKRRNKRRRRRRKREKKRRREKEKEIAEAMRPIRMTSRNPPLLSRRDTGRN